MKYIGKFASLVYEMDYDYRKGRSDFTEQDVMRRFREYYDFRYIVKDIIYDFMGKEYSELVLRVFNQFIENYKYNDTSL